MARHRADTATVAAFWDALAGTSDTFVSEMLARGGRSQTQEFVEVANLLAKVDPGLLLVLGAGGVRPEVVISAGGLREVFPLVQQVADAAPGAVTARYDVRAFRPRVPDPTRMRIQVKGQNLGPGDIRWDATRDRRDRTRCDLTLHVPGFIEALPADSPANHSVSEAVFLLLDHIVGEWAVVSQIGSIDWHSTKDSSGLPSLVDLPDYLDKISAERG